MSSEPLRFVVLISLALVSLPALLDGWALTEISQYLCYGILAISLALLWGQAGILCFGQALFFGCGAYAFGVVGLGILPWLPASPWLGLLASILVPPLLALALGLLLFFGRGASGAFLALITLAVGVIAERIAVSSPALGGSNGLTGLPPLSLPTPRGPWELVDPLPVYVIALLVTLSVVLISTLLIRTHFGSQVRAVRENELRAAHFGIDPRRVKLLLFVIAAAIAGLGGGLFAAQFGFVGPPLLGFGLSTEALVWVAVGGRGTPIGALLGALLVRLGEARLAEALGPFWLIAIGTAFVLVTIFFPRGLIGELLHRLVGVFHRRPTY